MKVVIGLGSPYLTDDSVGLRVVRALRHEGGLDATLVESPAGGLLLLEALSEARQAIIVDAWVTPDLAPGEIVVTGLDAASHNLACSHDCTVEEALAIGRALGLDLPEDHAIQLVAIVARDVTTFGESLSLEVEAAVDRACEWVCRLLAMRDSRGVPFSNRADRLHQSEIRGILTNISEGESPQTDTPDSEEL